MGKNGSGVNQMECTKLLIPSVTSRRDEHPVNIPKKIHQLYPNNGIGDWIGPQKGDQSPICYLSGSIGAKGFDENEFLKVTNCRFRCFSYAYCGFGSPLMQGRHVKALDACLTNGVRVFMDSGAHSFHKLRYYSAVQGKTFRATVGDDQDKFTKTFMSNYSQYIKWCYSTGRKFDFHVTLDSEKHCPTVFRMTEELFKMGIFPVPVYHGDQSISWLKKYADLGHRLIGVGLSRAHYGKADLVRSFYDKVVSTCERLGMVCHAFAVTGDLMFQFPFYSVDSTTWLKCAAYGKILDFSMHRHRVALIHISHHYAASTKVGTLDAYHPSVFKYVRDSVEKNGFDLDALRKSISLRALYNAKVTVDSVNNFSLKKSNPWQKVF